MHRSVTDESNVLQSYKDTQVKCVTHQCTNECVTKTHKSSVLQIGLCTEVLLMSQMCYKVTKTHKSNVLNISVRTNVLQQHISQMYYKSIYAQMCY